MKRVMIGLLLAVILTLLLSVQAGADGLVFNAGMEDGWYVWNGWLYEVAENTSPGWAPPEEPDFAGVPSLKRPEFQRSTFAHSGTYSQVLKNVWSVGEGGLWADVLVGEGNQVTVGAWFYGFSSSQDGDDSVGGSMQFRVGIATNGETNWYRDDTVVWNETRDFIGNTSKDLDRWTYREVSAIAQVDVVRVWAWGRSEWPLKHNDCYIDDITVTAQGGTPVLPTPTTPVLTPYPRPTAYPTMPTETPVPTVGPTIIPTFGPTSTIGPTSTFVPTIEPTAIIAPTVEPSTHLTYDALKERLKVAYDNLIALYQMLRAELD